MASVPPAESDADVARFPAATPVVDNARPGLPSPDIAPEATGGDDTAPESGQSSAVNPALGPRGAPRVNDAMRVLSRMQIDLDVLTGGKRAATYPEVEEAFDDAIRALGIKLPPAALVESPGAEAAGAAAPVATATKGAAPEAKPYERNAVGEEQQGSGAEVPLSAATPQAAANAAPAPQPARQAQTDAPGTPAAGIRSGMPQASQPAASASAASSNGAKVGLWRGGTTVVADGLPVSIAGLNLTRDDYLVAVKQGLWSRVQGDDRLTKGFRDDEAVAAASAAVQKSVPVSTADVGSGDEVRQFIKEIAKATATARLGGKRGYDDDFERFFTIGRNSAHQLVITSIHVVGSQGAHVMSLIPRGSITIAHYHGSALVQPPNSGDNSAVRLGNISSFVIGNGGDTVWEVGRANGHEVFREIGRGGVPGRWQRYRP